MARALTMCGSSELTLADCDDCSKLLSRLEQLEKELDRCCNEVKTTLSAHDTRITTNANNIANNANNIANNAINIQANKDEIEQIKSDFSNYYTKAQMNSIIDSIENVEIKVVDALPDEGETNIIYLVPKEGGETPNVYDEYVYIGGWEKIGDTDIDLSDYITVDEMSGMASRVRDLETCCGSVDTALNSKQDKLTAGDNITIQNNVISATGEELTKDKVLEALGYRETTISITDTTGEKVTRTILVKDESEGK